MTNRIVEVEVASTREIDIESIANDLEDELLGWELPENSSRDYSTYDDLRSDDFAEVMIAIAEYWLQKYAGREI